MGSEGCTVRRLQVTVFFFFISLSQRYQAGVINILDVDDWLVSPDPLAFHYESQLH
jgi:hypothetical protein